MTGYVGLDVSQKVTVICVVDVLVPDEEGVANPITYSSSDPRRWVQEALLGEALKRAEADNDIRAMIGGEDEEEDE